VAHGGNSYCYDCIEKEADASVTNSQHNELVGLLKAILSRLPDKPEANQTAEGR
jgi:hypothetical protein